MRDGTSLPAGTPESEGVSSRAIAAFTRAIVDHRLCLHSILILRRGRLVAEGYAPPYHEGRKHRMYSITKSFTSLAVGLMIGEGKLSLDDPIVSFFPEYCPGPVHPFLAAATIRDMLTMRDCHDAPTHKFGMKDWLESWFAVPPDRPAGTVHAYNTTCTNLLCAIVERLSGRSLTEYLYPRLFDPIGFSQGCTCIKTPEGGAFGGSGLLCTPRDLAKAALLCMQGGRWEGRQIVPEDYIRAATARQADNFLANDDIEHQQGYGYQIWRTRHNGFAFWGMGTQFAVCLPDQDLLVVTTGDTQGTSPDTSVVLRTLWETLLPSLSESPLPEDPDGVADMEAALGQLAIIAAPGGRQPSSEAAVSEKSYRFAPNPAGWQEARFVFSERGGTLRYVNSRGEKEISFGFGAPESFVFPETGFNGLGIGTPKGTGYEAWASAGWFDARTLTLLCYLTDDHLGSWRVTAVFDGDRLVLRLRKNAEDFLEDYQGTLCGYASPGRSGRR